MSVHHDNKIIIRKEIASLIDALKSESDRIGSENSIPGLVAEQLLEHIETLHQKLVIYTYLEEHPDEEVIEEEKSQIEFQIPVAVPQTEPTIPEKDIVAPVIFQNPVVEIPVVPETPVAPTVPVTPPAPPKKKFPDIKTFIGFNERLMFVKNLFGNQNSAYEEALALINNCASVDEANAFVSSLSAEYKWNNDSEPVQLFLLSVKRRFA